MGRPVDIHNTILTSAHIARIQNTEQHRDETQRQQFALTLKQQTARKETQVQGSDKAEATAVHTKPKNKEKRKKRKKSPHKKDADQQHDSSEEEHHIDLKID